MKRMLMVLCGVMFASLVEAGPMKLAFRDYNWETPEIGFLSLGASTWHSRADSFRAGVYGNANMIMLWDERLNFGFGMVAANTSKRFKVRWVTTMNAHFFDFLELGVWYAPFYGYKGKDDPYGFMVGHYIKF